jgi:hypothetical protein
MGEDSDGFVMSEPHSFAELRVVLIFKLALRAFHPGASRKEHRWEWLGVLVLGSVLNSRKSR